MSTVVEAPAKTGPNLGPGSLANPAIPKGPAFALAAPEWIAVQVYALNGLALPTDNDSFRKYLGPGAPDDLSPFADLIACFLKISTDCGTWQHTTYPNSVSLASDIYQYGTIKAPNYYPQINTLADTLTNDPTDAKALALLKAILDNLTADAQARAANATSVKNQIQTFADNTQTSKTTLTGPPDNPGGLVKKYNDLYGAESTDVKTCTDTIKAESLELDADEAEYQQDVTIAATTATYAWVPFYGWIAAAVVAGVYGSRAVQALDRINAEKATIEAMNDKLQADANTMAAINVSEKGMTGIVDSLNAALPIIEKIEGVWGGIADDLAAIVKVIDTDIRQALPILMSLGVDEAIQSWANVAQAADAFRLNAYVVKQ